MVKKSTRIVGALALAGALMSNGPVSAATALGLDPSGDLSPSRTSADLTISVSCDAAAPNQTKTASLSVKIFQSVGRLLNIGTASATPTCTGTQADIDITVNAIPGLKFQPGPATVLITLNETSTDSAIPPIVTSTVTEIGGKVNLHP